MKGTPSTGSLLTAAWLYCWITGLSQSSRTPMSTKNLGKPCHSLVTTPRQSCDFLALRGLPTDTSSRWVLGGLAGFVAHLRALGRLGFGQSKYHHTLAVTLTSGSICGSGLSSCPITHKTLEAHKAPGDRRATASRCRRAAVEARRSLLSKIPQQSEPKSYFPLQGTLAQDIPAATPGLSCSAAASSRARSSDARGSIANSPQMGCCVWDGSGLGLNA